MGFPFAGVHAAGGAPATNDIDIPGGVPTLRRMNPEPGVAFSPSSSLPGTAEELLPLVYEELRRLAAHRMAAQQRGQTLQATALVHEVWLRLEREQKGWENRAQFFAAAAEAMRRILIEQARRRAAAKRGGNAGHDPLQDSVIEMKAGDDGILAVHEALDALAAEDEQAAILVKLRFFTGMSMAEAAKAMELPQRSAERLWTFARARLRSVIARGLE